jgi:TM2 domain-containing membrane protein YozV
MRTCEECGSPLEPFEAACHGCGKPQSMEPGEAAVPTPVTVADVAPAKPELEEAYSSWFNQGAAALQGGNWEEACNCLREAIKRSRALDEATLKEIAARQALAQALEKLNKLPEAADQYRIISQETADRRLKDAWLKKSQDLVASSSSLPFDLLFQKEEFRMLQDEEVKCVPLYCVGCKRLLAEAEVYGLRKGLTSSVRCWCGTEGRPLAKQDAKHSRALQEARTQTGPRRIQAVQVASRSLPGGRNKTVAGLLALTVGWLGIHKFYLGEHVLGLIYLLWSWTFIPLLISIYEAIMLFEMSTVTFNMTYNIELVLARTEPEDTRAPKMDVFRMEPQDESMYQESHSDS